MVLVAGTTSDLAVTLFLHSSCITVSKKSKILTKKLRKRWNLRNSLESSAELEVFFPQNVLLKKNKLQQRTKKNHKHSKLCLVLLSQDKKNLTLFMFSKRLTTKLRRLVLLLLSSEFRMGTNSICAIQETQGSSSTAELKMLLILFQDPKNKLTVLTYPTS